MLDASNEAAALERLHDLGCTDGLPVVIPTPVRVDAMLGGALSVDPDEVVGVVPPRMGQATVRDIAVNAVMAGALPVHFPIIVAAVRAVCDPAFALGVVQGTTHNAAVLMIVNGPIARREPRVASGAGALGPGHRANASIGRALRLVLINAGGAEPGTGDMSTLAQPAKFTCCLAEAEDASPFPPLSTARGLAPDESAVTVIAAEGPSQIMFVPIGDTAEADAERLIELLADTLAVPGALAALGYCGSGAIALCPLHAQVIAAAGYDRAGIQHAVYARAHHRAGEIRRRPLRRGGARARRGQARSCRRRSHHPSPGRNRAGGAGTYSAVFCGLAAGVGDAVTVPV
jgi:hypothetical protein